MLAQLACSGKKWCGFVAYDPRVKEERHRLFMRRFEPTTDEIMEVEDAAHVSGGTGGDVGAADD
jgi:hypothetical protein